MVEIKTTASLQHPHILPRFDSGAADGFLFYVLPYLAGETICKKLNRAGPAAAPHHPAQRHPQFPPVPSKERLR